MLLIILSGFFAAEDISRLATEKRAAHDRLLCPPNGHVTLVDVSECKIQPQAVLGAFAQLIEDPRYKARRLAFVTGSSLAKMQVLRLIQGLSAIRCFNDRAPAEKWLMEARRSVAA